MENETAIIHYLPETILYVLAKLLSYMEFWDRIISTKDFANSKLAKKENINVFRKEIKENKTLMYIT